MSKRTLSVFPCLLLSVLSLPSYAYAGDILPQGGQVVAGSGTIAQQNGAMTIAQQTDKMAIDWQSFSIGRGNSVTFNQPSADSIAMNRVLGSDVSVIQGALTANGKIFLINPNGVLFTPDAQVNVGALAASTLSLKTEDFMAGTYTFEGTSPNAVINQGHITAAAGGTVALIAAHIDNSGQITADQGAILAGAGSRVRLDFGGPVKIEVQQAALDAVINQGGGMHADGGLVYLTAKAAGELVTSVINHTGITEARGIGTGAGGQIVLLGDFDHDAIQVAGKMDASSAHGNGGTIETSAANVSVADTAQITAAAPNGRAGLWLMDPTNIAINASSCTGTNCVAADAIATTLNSGTDVSIATAAAGADAGNISINAPIAWTKNKLTFSAHNNIAVNGTLTATGTGTLAFLYGQGTTDGAGSTYTVADGVHIYIPSGTAFTWKKGSASSLKNLVLDNGKMRFGDGTLASINSAGMLLQPFYYGSKASTPSVTEWLNLTFSTYPLDIQISEGGTSNGGWNTSGTSRSTDDTALATHISNGSLDVSGYKEGTGTISSTADWTFSDSNVLRLTNTYTLSAGASFLKTATKVENPGVSSITNVRMWVGTRDDYVAGVDTNYKTKGNITQDGFVPITAQSQQANAIKITGSQDNTGAAVLFYSTSPAADTTYTGYGAFSGVAGTNPRSVPISVYTDGSYALFMGLNDLASGANGSMTWYYAAGAVADISNVINNIGQSAGVIPSTPPVTPPPPPPPPPVVVEEPVVPVQAAIQAAQTIPVITSASSSTPIQTQTATTLVTPPATLPPVQPASVPPTGRLAGSLNLVSLGDGQPAGGTSSGMQFASLPAPSAAAGQTGGMSESTGGSDSSSHSEDKQSGGDAALVFGHESADTTGFMNVFVVGGGVRLPTGAKDED